MSKSNSVPYIEAEEIKNCISKDMGTSYEAWLTADGKVRIFTYEGTEKDCYDTMLEAQVDYLFY